MSTPWKTVRVFISSTFRDMQAERDWLVRFVFPKLRESLLKYRIHCVDVDLRWGVTSDQNALGVCREVIDECHPRFICMLGGRYGWVPDGQDKSITADEIHYGALGREAGKRGYAFFYFRDDAATASMMEETPGDFREPDGSANATKLAALKQAIVDAGLPVFIYDAQWDTAQKRLTRLKAYGERVHADLLRSLKSDPDLAAHFTGEDGAQPDEFAEEAEQMEAFIEERVERYVVGSRQPLLDALAAFATAGGTPNIFVLTGDPGSGKSALLAKFTRNLTGEAFATRRPSFVIPHFIGASTGSTDLRRTLRCLCHQLARAAGNTELLPLDIKDLTTHFQKLLAETASKQGIIVVFDALNQFDATDGAHWLNWLPRELPSGVRIVASVIASEDGQREHQTLAILRARPDTRIEKLQPLTEADTLAVIEGSLRRYAKRLSPEQLAALLAKPEGRLPLYVLSALEELRTLGTYEEITDRIRTLPDDTRALFGWILTERLARDPGFRDREGRPCGAALVEKFAAYLGVSRHGLSHAELTALLDPGDPLGNVAALLRLLRPYLMRRGELLDFYHGQFREAVSSEYLLTEAQRLAAHRAVAIHFHDSTDPGRTGEWRGDSAHALSELPYHQIRAQMWTMLVTTLENIFFLEAKVAHGMAFGVAADFQDALRHLPPDHPHGRLLLLLEQALGNNLHFIETHARDYPQAVFQCLWNTGWWHDSEEMRKHYVFPRAEQGVPLPLLSTLLESWREAWQQARPETIWLKSLLPLPDRLSDRSPAKMINTGLGKITSVDISAHGMLAAGFSDGTVALWEAETMQSVHGFVTKRERVRSIQFSPVQPLLLGAFDDGSATIWDCGSGTPVLELKMGDETKFCGCFFSPHGRTLIRGGYSKVCEWDASTGVLLRSIPIEIRSCGPIHCIDVSPDGGLLAFSDHGIFGVINLQSGRLLWEKRANCQCLNFSRTGEHLFTGIGASLIVYRAESGGQEARVSRPGRVTCFSSNARGLIVSGSDQPDFDQDAGFVSWQNTEHDRSVQLWDWRSDAPPCVVGEFPGGISDVKFSPDGTNIASGSEDGVLRIFAAEPDPTDHDERRPVGMPRAAVVAIAASRDGVHVAVAHSNREVAVWRLPDFSFAAYLPGNRTQNLVTEPQPPGFDSMAYAMGWRDTTYEVTGVAFGDAPGEVILSFDKSMTWNGQDGGGMRNRVVWNWIADTVTESPLRPTAASQTGSSVGHRYVCDFTSGSEVVLREARSHEAIAWFPAREVRFAIAPGSRSVWVVASPHAIWAFEVWPPTPM